MQLKLVYLARLRDVFGRSTETLDSPPGASVGTLLETLRGRGGAWERELAAGRAVRIAVNHEMAAGDIALRDGDEVALLPPVTGG